jgi:hypothetical protein
MQATRWQKVEQIFNEALVLPENQRTSFIVQKSDDDVELSNEVLSLIAEIERDEKFLDDSVFTLGTELVKQELKTVLTQSDFGSYKLQKLFNYQHPKV